MSGAWATASGGLGGAGADGLAVGGLPGLPRYTLVDMGRVRVEDLPQDNPVAAKVPKLKARLREIAELGE